MSLFRWYVVDVSLVGIANLLSYAQSQSTVDHWSIKQLVEFHQQFRPDLQVQDVYKILYQANFGVEHILTDTAGVRTYVLEELASMDTTDRSEPLLERISTSGEMVRVNLRPFKAMNLNPEALLQLMYRSAVETRPDTLTFYREWNEFVAMVRYDLLKFPLNDAGAWDARLTAGFLQPVHHSEQYTQAWRPAYRVTRRLLFESIFAIKETR